MSREGELKKYLEKRALQLETLEGEVVAPASPLELAKEAALLNDMRADLSLKTIERTAALSAMVRYYGQFVPEIQGELQEMVHTYALLGIEQIRDGR